MLMLRLSLLLVVFVDVMGQGLILPIVNTLLIDPSSTFPPTWSQRAKWALEELGIEYASHVVDLQQTQQDSDAYRTIHPLGVMPDTKIAQKPATGYPR
ncbi:MAG: hypothetical protein GY789_27095 [Hyphomicrobiales bacterium]|nr:hypothetical protein [Hyphomicrobiales bacterium]